MSLALKIPRKEGAVTLRRLLPWMGVLLFLGVFFFYPLARILALSLNLAVLDLPGLKIILRALGFTAWQATLSTLLTLLLGVPAAFLFARYDFRGRRLLRTLTAIPFILPTVVVAAGFNAWLGERGWLNLGLQGLFDLPAPPITFIGTLGAILAAHVFYNTTIIIRILGSALRRLDPRLAQAARSLGAGEASLLWRVTLPVLLPSLLSALTLVFLFDFTSFGVILLLGGPSFATLEVEIYLQTLTYLNLPLSAWLSLVQLVCTLAVSIVHSRLNAWLVVPLDPKPNPLVRPRRWRERIFVASLGIVLLLFFFFPLFSLPLRSVLRTEAGRGERGQTQAGLSLVYYTELFKNRNDSLFHVPPLSALTNSLAYAALTVVLSLALGFSAARALARPGRLERLLDPLLMLPFGASAVTLGLGFLLAFGRLIASPWLVPLAHTLVALPFVIRTLQPSLAAIPISLYYAAASLGASPRQVWRQVDWPLLRRPILAAAVFAFTVSLGEFGATLLVVRPEYPTLPMAIYRFLSQPGGLNYGQAMAMATLLMFVAGAGILLLEKLRFPANGDL